MREIITYPAGGRTRESETSPTDRARWLLALIERLRDGASTLVVDLSALEWPGQEDIATLRAAHDLVQAQGARMLLRGLGEDPFWILRFDHHLDVLELEPDEAELQERMEAMEAADSLRLYRVEYGKQRLYVLDYSALDALNLLRESLQQGSVQFTFYESEETEPLTVRPISRGTALRERIPVAVPEGEDPQEYPIPDPPRDGRALEPVEDDGFVLMEAPASAWADYFKRPNAFVWQHEPPDSPP